MKLSSLELNTIASLLIVLTALATIPSNAETPTIDESKWVALERQAIRLAGEEDSSTPESTMAQQHGNKLSFSGWLHTLVASKYPAEFLLVDETIKPILLEMGFKLSRKELIRFHPDTLIVKITYGSDFTSRDIAALSKEGGNLGVEITNEFFLPNDHWITRHAADSKGVIAEVFMEVPERASAASTKSSRLVYEFLELKENNGRFEWKKKEGTPITGASKPRL